MCFSADSLQNDILILQNTKFLLQCFFKSPLYILEFAKVVRLRSYTPSYVLTILSNKYDTAG